MSGTMPTNTSMSKVEFDAEMTCEACGESIRKLLQHTEGVKSFVVDVPKQSVVVESELPSEILRGLIENMGIKTVLKGIGSVEGKGNLGAAVAEMQGVSGIYGVVRFHQLNKEECVVDGTIDGLSQGEHGLHIHEYGDLSDGCNSLGEHFNPSDKSHGDRLAVERHYGDLGNVVADSTGRATFIFRDSVVKVWDIIGRSLAVTEGKDDLGLGSNEQSKVNGNSGKSLACAIIARSAGLFENPKRLCQCDGISIWEERDVPSAGESRSARGS